MTRVVAVLVLLGASRTGVAMQEPSLRSQDFDLAGRAEVVAVVEARCERCDWGSAGREGASLRLEVDGSYARHHVLARGADRAPARIALGAFEAGRHRLDVRLDRAASASGAAVVEVTRVSVEAAYPGEPGYARLAHAPVLYERPGTAGRFTDVPLLVWVEEDPLPDGGRRLRYSVVFSNEDGGTPPDRLLATWGRLTDLEYAYGVELGPDGAVRRAEFQGRGHVMAPFDGEREGDHPLLYVVTDNNMLAATGERGARYAPAPRLFDLTGTSREAVMDAEPWTWRVSSQEARREGRVAASASPGDGLILDPRRYLYLEACAETSDVGLTFGAGLATPDGLRFVDSDGGEGVFLVLRSADHFPNGCFRSAVALPADAGPEAVVALRFRAHTRPPRSGEEALPSGSGRARLLRVTKLFTLGPDDRPNPSLFAWEGDVALQAEGEPVVLRVKPRGGAAPGAGALPER